MLELLEGALSLESRYQQAGSASLNGYLVQDANLKPTREFHNATDKKPTR
jgi:hypothetical protein